VTHDLGELHIHLRAQLTSALKGIAAALTAITRALADAANALRHPTPRQRRARTKALDRLARDQRNARWPHATRVKTTYHRRRR
jgi:phytoene dehydrogenase-like protein